MKKPQDTKVIVSRRASAGAVGIRDIQVVRGPKGYRSLLVKIEPHFTIVVNGGRKPTVTLMYSHHGVTLDTFDRASLRPTEFASVARDATGADCGHLESVASRRDNLLRLGVGELHG